jgi:LmbE family N-acetylglucosaminyl deacetylase
VAHTVASYTVVSFHAHPDDEALLTAGTLARIAAEGHRVVLVSATAGEVGLAAASFGTQDTLATHRRAELRRSADAIGAARVEILGYGDSGLDGRTVPAGGVEAFARADVEEAADRLAAILREERADVLTSYDPSGGYGHPDHVQVHHVGARAAELAGTPVVLEATVDQDLLRRAVRLAARVYRFPPEFDRAAFEHAYAPRRTLTHRVDVRRYGDRKPGQRGQRRPDPRRPAAPAAADLPARPRTGVVHRAGAPARAPPARRRLRHAARCVTAAPAVRTIRNGLGCAARTSAHRMHAKGLGGRRIDLPRMAT